jgi:hypothetical protein
VSRCSVDEPADRLRWAGGWVVTGTNGENALDVSASTQAGAWWSACEAARVVGLLAVVSP